MSKLTARQERIKAHAEKYYPTFEVRVAEEGPLTYLHISNPARPYAGTLSISGFTNVRTRKENNLASETYPGQPYARVALNDVTSRLREMV